MAEIIRIQDLKQDEISRLLLVHADGLADDSASGIQDSAAEISNVKRACDTFARLNKLHEAA
jgi:hypothetical protein